LWRYQGRCVGERGAADHKELGIVIVLALLILRLPVVLRETEHRLMVPGPLYEQPPFESERAQATVAFLAQKSTSAELYAWRSSVLGGALSTSLNLAHFVARKIWLRCGVSPIRLRSNRLQRREPQ
jgi:hypothetical protein